MPKSIVVSPNGTDAQDGGELTPLLTVNRAIAVSLPGDSIVIRGVVTGQTVAVNKSGTPEASISIVQHTDGGAIDGGFVWPKVGANAVVMKAPDGTIGHYTPLVNITASYVRWSVDVRNSLGKGIVVSKATGVVLSDFVIDWCRNGCLNIMDSTDVQLLRAKWHHGGCYYQAMRNPAQYNWPVACYIQRSKDVTVEECEGSQNWGEGLAAARGSSGVVVTASVFIDNMSVNLYADRAVDTGFFGNFVCCTGTIPNIGKSEGISLRNEYYADGTPPMAAVDVAHNIVLGCSKGIVIGRSELIGEPLQRVDIYRNTLVDNGVNLFANAVDHRSVIVEENIGYQTMGGVQAQVSGIKFTDTGGFQRSEYTFKRNGWGGIEPPANVRSDTDVSGIMLDEDYAPLANYGMGAIDYVAPPLPPDPTPPPVDDEIVRIVLQTKMPPALAAEFRKLLAGRTYTASFE